MTVSDQLAMHSRSTRWQIVGRIFSFVLALIVIIMALALFKVNTRAADTANRVDKALGQSVVAICQSRVTTLGTAPITVRDYRAIVDAESPAARLVCPGLDYDGLKAHREAEIKLLASGVTPEEIAKQRVEG